MNSTIPDLWPDNLTPVATEPSPVKILRQQAYALGQKTRNFVVGHVKTVREGEYFKHDFDILVPLLDDEQTVLVVTHKRTTFYPAEISLNGEVGSGATRYPSANNSQEFMAQLQSIFAEKRMTDRIGELLSQCDIEDDE
jgi:hypothetical protein